MNLPFELSLPSPPPFLELCKKDDPRWLELRTTGIGSSESPSLLGLGECEWQSALSIWTEKTLGPAPYRDDEKLRAGRVLQPAIAELARIKLEGLEVREIEILYRSRRCPWITATPDFWILLPELGWVLLETKNTTKVDEWNRDEPHPRPWIQCQQQMLVMGQRIMVLVGLVNGFDVKPFFIERDDKFLDEILIPETCKLWCMVQSGSRPKPDHSEASRQAIERQFPDVVPRTIELDLDAQEIDELLEVNASQLRPFEQERDRLRNELRITLGSADRGVLPNGDEWNYKSDRRGVRSLKRSPQWKGNA